jgi:hypothetical protein
MMLHLFLSLDFETESLKDQKKLNHMMQRQQKGQKIKSRNLKNNSNTPKRLGWAILHPPQLL